MTGRTVSHFEIIQKVGEGGAGVVYKAVDLRLNRFVALKFLRPDLLTSEEAVQRFLREARTISSLNHPNIATIYEIGEENGQRFLVLEYFPGGTLAALIRELRAKGGCMSFRDAADYGAQIAAGLAHAHRHGVVHRDVKPANVMCTAEGTLKVTDFGLAKSFGADDVTRPGSVAGTVSYMSPEQAQGGELDQRTDIYSFGVVLYEMISGQRPFAGPHEVAVLHAILHDAAPPLRQLRHNVPRSLEALVDRAMARDRDARYPSLEEVEELLGRVRDEFLAPEVHPPIGPDDSTASIEAAPARSRKWAVLAAGVLAVASAAGFSVWLWPDRCLWAPAMFRACTLPPDKHLAVLPFDYRAAGSEERALLQGLEQHLTSGLSQLAKLDDSLCVHVIRRAGDASVATVAMGGRLGKENGSIGLRVRLSDTRSQLPIRQIPVQARLTEVPLLQYQLAARLAESLGVEVSPRARETLAEGGTLMPDAFQCYLEGLGYLANGDVDRAIARLDRAAGADPTYARAHAALGEAFRQRHAATRDARWIEKAREHCERAIDLHFAQAPVYSTLGRIHWTLRRFNLALRYFQLALDSDPVNPEIRRELARAYEARGLESEAEATYRDAIKLRPKCSLAYLRLGRFFWDRGRYREAGTHFARSAELAPYSPHVYNNLGALYLSADLLDEARSWLEKSLAIRPLASAYSNLGIVHIRSGCFSNAAAMMEKARALGGDNHQIWDTLAEAYLMQRGREPAAREAFLRAAGLAERELVKAPNDTGLRALLAYYYASTGNAQQARNEVANALKSDPRNVNVLFRAALVYEITSQRELALHTLGDAVKGGYSKREVCASPSLRELRKDPRFFGMLPGGCIPTKGCPEQGPPG